MLKMSSVMIWLVSRRLTCMEKFIELEFHEQLKVGVCGALCSISVSLRELAKGEREEECSMSVSDPGEHSLLPSVL